MLKKLVELSFFSKLFLNLKAGNFSLNVSRYNNVLGNVSLAHATSLSSQPTIKPNTIKR